MDQMKEQTRNEVAAALRTAESRDLVRGVHKPRPMSLKAAVSLAALLLASSQSWSEDSAKAVAAGSKQTGPSSAFRWLQDAQGGSNLSSNSGSNAALTPVSECRVTVMLEDEKNPQITRDWAGQTIIEHPEVEILEPAAVVASTVDQKSETHRNPWMSYGGWTNLEERFSDTRHFSSHADIQFDPGQKQICLSVHLRTRAVPNAAESDGDLTIRDLLPPEEIAAAEAADEQVASRFAECKPFSLTEDQGTVFLVNQVRLDTNNPVVLKSFLPVVPPDILFPEEYLRDSQEFLTNKERESLPSYRFVGVKTYCRVGNAPVGTPELAFIRSSQDPYAKFYFPSENGTGSKLGGPGKDSTPSAKFATPRKSSGDAGVSDKKARH